MGMDWGSRSVSEAGGVEAAQERGRQKASLALARKASAGPGADVAAQELGAGVSSEGPSAYLETGELPLLREIKGNGWLFSSARAGEVWRGNAGVNPEFWGWVKQDRLEAVTRARP